MWSSSINIYIYTYIIVCALYSILGAKEEKATTFFLATFFSPFHVVYTTIFYTQFIFISQLNL